MSYAMVILVDLLENEFVTVLFDYVELDYINDDRCKRS